MSIKKSSSKTQGFVIYKPSSLNSDVKPTLDMYGFVQAAYDHFNESFLMPNYRSVS